MTFQAAYLKLGSKDLEGKIDKLYSILKSCELCPRKCGVNRMQGEKGYCKSGKELMVSSVFPHFGEEPELVGTNGSGTVFLAGCNLLCCYCQNFDISHLGKGTFVTEEELADAMLGLQAQGCHNINFVTPTHFIPQIVKGIMLGIEKGLRLPIVYNCGGYENVEIIRLLNDIVDIYMPDIKYSDPVKAKKYSNAGDYFDRCKEAVREMHRQVGDLKTDDKDQGRGVALRGLLVRHLVLPNRAAGSEPILRFLAGLSKDTYVNIMDQFRPCYRADSYPEINRHPTLNEYSEVVEMAKRLGLHRGF